MQVLLELNGELKLMTEEEFEKTKDELDEFDGIHPYIVRGWLHDKKPICNICNDYLDDDSRPVGAQVSRVCGDLEEYGKWLNEFAKLTKDKNNNNILYNITGYVEIYINGDCWLSANNYKQAHKKYLKIIKDWNS